MYRNPLYENLRTLLFKKKQNAQVFRNVGNPPVANYTMFLITRVEAILASDENFTRAEVCARVHDSFLESFKEKMFHIFIPSLHEVEVHAPQMQSIVLEKKIHILRKHFEGPVGFVSCFLLFAFFWSSSSTRSRRCTRLEIVPHVPCHGIRHTRRRNTPVFQSNPPKTHFSRPKANTRNAPRRKRSNPAMPVFRISKNKWKNKIKQNKKKFIYASSASRIALNTKKMWLVDLNLKDLGPHLRVQKLHNTIVCIRNIFLLYDMQTILAKTEIAAYDVLQNGGGPYQNIVDSKWMRENSRKQFRWRRELQTALSQRYLSTNSAVFTVFACIHAYRPKLFSETLFFFGRQIWTIFGGAFSCFFCVFEKIGLH